MILDNIRRLSSCPLPHLAQAMECLERVKDAPPGRYEFSGGFLMIQEGITTPMGTGCFEAHRKYLDVQLLLRGAETILWAPLEAVSPAGAYDPQADRSAHTGAGTPIPITPGTFYVCFPQDAHQCCLYTAAPTPYRKAVIKLRLDGKEGE